MQKTLLLITIIIISLLCSFSSGAYSQQPDASKPQDKEATGKNETKIDAKIVDALRTGKIMLNFDSVDIRAITKIMSEITKRTIIMDSKVTGTITILSSRKVGMKEAWDLYVSALEAAGYGLIDYGKYLKVAPVTEASKENTKYVGSKYRKLKRGFVVAIVLLQAADAELMANTLRPMMTTNGYIGSYMPSNAIVMTDTSTNISRLTQIIKHLDTNYRGNMLRVYQPKHVRVKELATALAPLFAAGGNTTPDKQTRVSAYEPTNSLLIMATEKDFIQIESILSDIDSEDRVVKPDQRRFYVHYLINADAEEVAKVISNMMEEKKRIVEEVKKEQQGTEESKQKETFVSTKVSFDKSTNSLVFYLTEKEYEDMKKMITLLDAERKQVLVSAIIAEVSMSKVSDIGARWHVASNAGLASFQGGLSLESLYQALANGSFVVGGMGGETTTINVGGKELKYPNIFGIISLLETDNNFNILSAPRILAMDHLEANINVGKIVPFATGVKYDNNSQPVITYDYKDIGLNLKVTPHISQGDNIRLKIDQVVKDVIEYLKPQTGAVGYVVPVVGNREFHTTITLMNNQTIIIGGLIDNTTKMVIKSVPFFSKLPLIGDLFKDTHKEVDKSTLFVFITPHIIHSPKDLQDIVDKYGRVLHEDKARNDKAPFIINEDKEGTH